MRTRPWRRWLPYLLIVGGVVGGVVAPLLVLGGPYAWASFRSMLARSSYETVWALLDGNLRTGLLVPILAHFDVKAAVLPVGNPARVPEWLRTVPFALVYLGLFWKADLRLPRQTAAFVGLTLVIFFLWSKGWSPQWQVFLFPFIFLALPYRQALLFVLVLSAVNLAEWPILLSRGRFDWLYLTVLLRTGLFVLLAMALWQQMKKRGEVNGSDHDPDSGL